MPISLPEALSGAKVQAPTISGAVSLTVPKGANTGTTLRLKGKGIQRAGGKPGDQYVTLRVMLPETPDPALAELVEDWARDHPYNPRKLAGLE